MSFLRFLLEVFIAGVILLLAYMAAGVIGGVILLFLPLAFLGDYAVWVALVIEVLALGVVGRFAVPYIARG